MKKGLAVVIAAVVLVAASVCYVQASTPDEAKALAEKAAVFWKANGKDKAIAEFNNPKGQFVKGDLYIVAHDWKGNVLAHGGNPSLVGANLYDQKDPSSGKLFVREQIELAKTKGSGWVDFTWANPFTKKLQPKRSWVRRIEGEDYLVNCGAFH